MVDTMNPTRKRLFVRKDKFDPRNVSELDHWLRQRNMADQQITRLVKILRDDDCPWEVIGTALNVSKQAAQKRYGKS